MASTPTECPVPTCSSGPCRTAAPLILAEAAEVPVGCPNRIVLADPATQLPRLLSSTDLYTTPRAAELISVRPGGGRRSNLLGSVSGGRLVLLEPRVRRPIRGGSLAQGTAAPDLPPIVVATEEKTSWIKFRVVEDETGDPIPGVKLRVQLPNGQFHDYSTRPDGMVEVDNIDPGICNVDCPLEPLDKRRLTHTLDFVAMGEASTTDTSDEPPPEAPSQSSIPSGELFVAEIEEHQVQTGESLESLATANSMSWKELALFNWGTAVPKEINEHLRDDVGCTEKTADGHNYIFSSEDEPGIVYIPSNWSEPGRATEQEHTIRVRVLGPDEPLPPWEFSV